MQFTESETKTGRADPAEVLRRLEKQFGWEAKPWHFELLRVMAPHEVHAWFGLASLSDKRMFFDGKTRRGVLCFDTVRAKYTGQLFKAFGDIEVCLASQRVVVRSFRTIPSRANRSAETTAAIRAATEKAENLFGGVNA
ncbi:MAG TPA: hypothetical protein PLX33_10425 [Alphaproteobacteria bacterium]|nr:hypothetical protein [Alphaproteobacteria bacterium]